MKKINWLHSTLNFKNKPNKPNKFEKRFLFILLICILSFGYYLYSPLIKSGFGKFTGIKQEISFNCYITEVYFKGDRIINNMDFIDNNWNDSIICFRYNEGIKLIEKYQQIDNIKCK